MVEVVDVEDVEVEILDQVSLEVPDPPLQVYPLSTAHKAEHPSFGVVFPSSQVSEPTLYPSPQVVTQVGYPPEVVLV